jgi:hypothetical protein
MLVPMGYREAKGPFPLRSHVHKNSEQPFTRSAVDVVRGM